MLNPALIAVPMRRDVHLLAVCLIGCGSAANGQVLTEPLQEMSDKSAATRTEGGDQEKAKDESEKSAKPDFLIVPIPISSPTLGHGLTLAGAVFYNPRGEPEPWISGVGLMRTSNGSRAIGAMHKMSLGQDRFRLMAFGGYARINMNFYGIGPNAAKRDVSIELEEKGFAGLLQGQYRVANHVYVGIRAEYLKLDTSVHNDEPRFPELELPRPEFKSTLAALGPVLTYDSQNSSLTPTNGEYLGIAWMFGLPKLGSDFSYNKVNAQANIYRPLGRRTVIAGRAALCGVSDGAPFYDLCMYGASNDLRGYETGRYRDGATWAAQVELRQHLFWRLGAAVFAGVGGVAPKLGALDDSVVLPSAGIGLRFQPSKETPVNVRVDYARGKDSHALYISVGEAF